MAATPVRSRGSAPRRPAAGRVVATVLALLALAPAAASPQQPATAGPAAEAAASEPAELTFGNRPIFRFRAPLGALPPEERVQAASRYLEAAAVLGTAADVSTRPIDAGVVVLIGDRRVFTVTPGDIEPLSGETLEGAASEAAARLRVALAETRELRRPAAFLRAAALAALATLLFVLFLRLVLAVRRWLLARAARPESKASHDVSVAGFTLLQARQLAVWLRRGVELACWGTSIFAGYLWLAFVLTRFPYSRPWGEALGGYLVTISKNLVLGSLRAVPGLFIVLVIFLAARLVASLIASFFHSIETGEIRIGWLHPDTALPTRRIVSALVWVFAVVVAYPYLPGSSSQAFQGISVLIGVMISLGSTGLVNQYMCGLMLMYSRALRPGQYVKIGDTEGWVVQLGWLSTRIRTYRNEEVNLPNAVVVGTTTRNYSAIGGTEGPIVHTEVTIGYDAPWRQVHAMLLSAAERTPGLRREPPPVVVQRSLSDFYVTYEVVARLEDPDTRFETLSALHGNIQDTFNEHGVQIMSPHFIGQPPQPVVVPKAKWFEAPAKGAGS